MAAWAEKSVAASSMQHALLGGVIGRDLESRPRLRTAEVLHLTGPSRLLLAGGKLRLMQVRRAAQLSTH